MILRSSENLDKSDIYTFMRPWLGTGLLTSTGKQLFSVLFHCPLECSAVDWRFANGFCIYGIIMRQLFHFSIRTGALVYKTMTNVILVS